MKKAEITTTIKLIPHPEPQRLVDIWARIIVNGIFKQEDAAAGGSCNFCSPKEDRGL
ncbi:hypothetical protein [Paenibacillus sp. DMB5]|uniref:hypothetical protein n=1 Tax=Paenibacillus sp. DMB5 TaxID=1780103 RepID=UPI0012FFC7C3|nr:hypothetical protein [Paenibacillus sp. DMB5]